MRESEEYSEPFQDSGSEYQPSILSGRKSPIDSDDSLSDLEFRDVEINVNNKQIDQNQSCVHTTVDGCNLNIPVNLDGSNNSPANLDAPVASSSGAYDRKSRKRVRDKKEWKKNIRKRLRQAGQEYKSCKGDTVQAKIPKRNCVNCRFKCLDNFSEEEVALIHREFWQNTDSEKGFFYDKTTHRFMVQRKRNRNVERKRTKTYSFNYYFVKNAKKIRVCKAFYLGVLSISQIRISYFYTHKRTGITTTPIQDKRGSRTSTRILDEKRQVIRDHINMFPRIPSHYCRSSSSREYLERSLSLSKMYDVYIEYCTENNLIPAEKWLYNHIFNEFNIGFHKPKKDLCEVCSEYDSKKQEAALSDDLEEKYRTHIEAKLTAGAEKLKDVEALKGDDSTALICFDMQSVLTCPQTQISKAYYKKKFAVYNLTGFDIVQKRGYCTLWHELLGGRKGIDIASALYLLLEKLLEERPNVKTIILWSDSCVPQNKNSHMSAALLYFLKKHPTVEGITQKFQVPGHSCVQEVDAMHSVLDRHLNKLELHSPLAIFKAIKNVRSKKPYKLTIMQKQHFLDFKMLSKCMTLTNVPYKNVVQIAYENNVNIVKFKLKFGEVSLHPVSLLKGSCRQNSTKTFLQGIPDPIVQSPPENLPQDKIAHIRSLANHFSAVDLQFWKCIIKDF